MPQNTGGCSNIQYGDHGKHGKLGSKHEEDRMTTSHHVQKAKWVINISKNHLQQHKRAY